MEDEGLVLYRLRRVRKRILRPGPDKPVEMIDRIRERGSNGSDGEHMLGIGEGMATGTRREVGGHKVARGNRRKYIGLLSSRRDWESPTKSNLKSRTDPDRIFGN
jgi:hypothetical protein